MGTVEVGIFFMAAVSELSKVDGEDYDSIEGFFDALYPFCQQLIVYNERRFCEACAKEDSRSDDQILNQWFTEFWIARLRDVVGIAFFWVLALAFFDSLGWLFSTVADGVGSSPLVPLMRIISSGGEDQMLS